MTQTRPRNTRYLHRRVFRVTALRLGLFTVIFFGALVLFEQFMAADLGDWIADATSEWTVYRVSDANDEARILGELTAADPNAFWESALNSADGTLRVRNVTVYTWLHDLWLPVAIALYILGCLIIVALSLRRTLSYFDELEGAVEGLLQERTQPVTLNRDLRQTEDGLNAIRERTVAAELASAEAERRKNELVAYLAHDLRTPLTSIIGYHHLLLDDDLDEATRTHYQTITLAKSEELNDLISELFTITRLNVSELALDQHPLDLDLLCLQVVEELYPLAQARHLKILTDSESETTETRPLTVTADGPLLARAVLNLGRNAITYADPGTAVTIRTAATEDHVTITVANQGPTIAPEHLNQVFEPFYREDVARSTGHGGAGLGLAITREIVEAHHGAITVASADRRTTFTIALPANG